MACLFAVEGHPLYQPSVSRNAGVSSSCGVCRSPKCPHPIPEANPVASVPVREGMGEIPADAWDSDGSSEGSLPTGTAINIQANTDTILTETKMKHNSRWAECRAVWMVTTHEPWLLTLCLDSWAVLKRLTPWLWIVGS